MNKIIKGTSINSSLLGFVQQVASQGNDDEAYRDIREEDKAELSEVRA